MVSCTAAQNSNVICAQNSFFTLYVFVSIKPNVSDTSVNTDLAVKFEVFYM